MIDGLGTINPDTLLQLDALHHRQMVEEAAKWRLLHGFQEKQSSWLAQQGGKMLCQLGHLLINFGQRLEHRGTVHVTSC
ncbi:MAG: hypothetical protein JXA33_04835 [Anaerolineae bacterium]|nr:hypothetical protein [Anaerolineae bacterium]